MQKLLATIGEGVISLKKNHNLTGIYLKLIHIHEICNYIYMLKKVRLAVHSIVEKVIAINI